MKDNEQEGKDPKKDGLRKKLYEILGMDSDKASDGEVPEGYESCTSMYRAVHKKLGKEIHLGIDKPADKYYVGFGSNPPFILNEDELIYMMTGMSALTTESLKDNTGKDMKGIASAAMKCNAEIKLSKGSITNSDPGKEDGAETSEELKKKIYEEEETEESSKKEEEIKKNMEEIKGDLEEIKNMSEQVDEFTKKMSPEEKKAYIEDLNRKHEEQLAKKAREFERSLLGSIEEEENVTYNYDYFKDIHEKQGAAALKEELAKLPKEERQEIIDKIKAEYKIKQQQTTNTDETAN